MEMPKFLIADNSNFEEDIFIVHTQFPRFILNIATDDIDWIDTLEKEAPEEISDEVEKLLQEAEKFYENEMSFYENEALEDI